MVNLVLNPKNSNLMPVKGKNSKGNKIIINKVPSNLNPFQEGIQNNIINNIDSKLLVDKYSPNAVKDLVGLDSSYYYVKKWYYFGKYSHLSEKKLHVN